ncbi:MAG TPA: hypothetical protein VGM16_09175 [Gammaproteobacteria bacterium]|jgi:hypothetical protein
MSGGGSASGAASIPPYLQPFYGTALGQAANLLQSGGPQYYTGQQVAGFNPTQQNAMRKMVNTGMNGSPALSAAQGFDQTLLQSGGGSNPYLDQMYGQAAGATQNQLSSEFAGMGRNASASEPLRAEQLKNLATSMYGGQYQNNIQNALAAGNQAQGLYGTKLQGLQTAAGVGQQVQDQSQKMIDASKGAYDYNQNLPYQNWQSFMSMLGGIPGQGGGATGSGGNSMSNDLAMLNSLAGIYKNFSG